MTNESKRKLPRGIHQTSDGRFRIYATRQGKPVRLTVTWDLLSQLRVPIPSTRLLQPGLELAKAALVKQRSKFMEEERTGAVEANAKVRIGDLLILMEQEYARKGKRTWSHAIGRWNKHLKAHFSSLTAAELTSDHIDRYIFNRQREGAKGSTVNRELAVVQHMLKLGRRTTPPKVLSVPHFPRLAESPARQGFVEQAEYDVLRQHASELWLRALLATAYTFAFRKSELLDMRVRQVSLLDGTIQLSTSKNNDPRIVVMTSEVRALLAALIQGKQPGDYVFTREDGSAVRDFRDSWEKLFAVSGMGRRLFHDLRRSAVRNAIRRGVDRDTVMRISGHKTGHVFSRYNIQSTDDLRAAARLIENGATDTKTDNVTLTTEPRLQ
jgi:integrase